MMKRFSTIRSRILLLLGAFFLLVMISVGVMFSSLHTQQDDALIINLAGRQRMLTQKMTWLALTQADDPELAAASELFEQTLQALSFGGTTLAAGKAVQLPPPPDADLQAQLEEVSQTWEQFRAHLQPPNETQLPRLASAILEQLDQVVSAYENRAELKQQRLAIIQIAFLLTALFLLAWGFLTTRDRIIHPLVELGKVVRKMGAGDLENPLPRLADDELGELAQTFEIMRAELAASRRLLEDQVDQRTRELSAAFEFSQEIVAQRDLDALMNSAIERARALMDARSAALCILTPDGRELEMMTCSSEKAFAPGIRQSIQRGIALPVIQTGQTVVEKAICADCSFLAAQHPGSCVVTPLRAADQTIGALCVVRPENGRAPGHTRFDSNGKQALALLANSAAIAITNARLAEAERRKAGEAAALAEREQLAADLHDNLAQTLSYTGLQLEQLDESLRGNLDLAAGSTLKQIEAANQTAYQQVRAALTGLLRPVPSGDDFARKLTDRLAEFQARSGVPVELEIVDQTALCLPAGTQVQVLYILGEALANIHQHAQAGNVRVRLERLGGQACFSIEDDGSGFDLDTPANGDHFGLQIMRTRASRSGGEFSLDSRPGKGTHIWLTYPLTEPAPGGAR